MYRQVELRLVYQAKGESMKKHYRLSFIFGLLITLSVFVTSPVYAGKNAGSGSNVLNVIKNNPCGNFYYNTGGTHSVPVATCDGYRAGEASIQVLIRGWDIEPAYPIANVPFSVGIGIDKGSAIVNIPSKATVTYPNQIKFNGYRTKIYLEPVEVNGDFNGSFLSNPSFTFNDWYVDKIEIDQALVNKTEVFSASDLHSVYKSYYLVGGDTVYLGMSALTSSYHAANPSIYKGEPAYRLGIISYYLVQASVSWDSYQEWVIVDTRTETVCSPGRNVEGLYDCVQEPGGHYLNGHYTIKTVVKYGWEYPPKPGTGYEGPRVSISVIETDKVRWPDGTIHDHIPILVYQSQPLLQKP